MSFAIIGLLIAFREVCIAILEIPTGAVADVTGRRKAMIFSFLTYIISFAIFAYAREIWWFFPAMFFFAFGEAFRTGTHKAIIFDWLKHEDRADEKTEIYGYTRSWSKIGSAASLPIAAAIVFFTGDYTYAFLVTIIPYIINIGNFYTYPNYLDGPKRKADDKSSVKEIFHTLWASFKHAVFDKKMRRLLLESMNYEGLYRTTKDYLLAGFLIDILSIKNIKIFLASFILFAYVGGVLIPLMKKEGRFCYRIPHDWRQAITVLNEALRPNDVIILRSGFIKENWIPETNDPIIIEYVKAPLNSFYYHPEVLKQSPDSPINVYNMTFSKETDFYPYYDSIFDVCEKLPRVWMIGVNPPNTNYYMKQVPEIMRNSHGKAFEKNFSGVYLVLLVKRPDVYRMFKSK